MTDPIASHDADEVAARADPALVRDIAHLKALARRSPWSGRGAVPQVQHRVVASFTGEPGLLVSVLLTYDRGTHASGWWRNSEYDQCWHLSLAAGHLADIGDARHPEQTFVDLPRLDLLVWARLVFGDARRYAWTEPPAGEKDAHRTAPASRWTTHVRVFTDRATGRPIKPHAEVYTLIPWPEGGSPAKVFR